MPDIKQGSAILLPTIDQQKRHIDYEHVCEIAEDYTAYATGEGIEKHLKRFVQRETQEAFQQRLDLTQVNTPDIVSRLKKPLAKVGKTPASVSVVWQGKDTKATVENKKKLFEIGSEFWGDKSVDRYLSQRIPELDTIDPNSFLVIEFKENVDEKDPNSAANPYPFEVNSEEAINYIYLNNELQWLIVLNKTIMFDENKQAVDAELYFMYLDNETIKATQVYTKTILEYQSQHPELIVISNETNLAALNVKQKYLYRTGKPDEKDQNIRWYVIEFFEHKIGFVPAKRIGTTLDIETRFRTCVPVIHPAQCYIEKSIKAVSELDLTMCLHAFPQKITYSDPCDGQKNGDTIIGCVKGVTPSGTTCKACNGTGFKGHTSAQDVIQIRMPRETNELVNLENILVYKHPPIDLLAFQKDFAFNSLIDHAVSAVYNSNLFSKQQISETATGKEIDLDSVYDTLKDFADNYSELFVFAYTCIASLRDMEKDIIITHSFPADFKMQSLDSLLDDLKKANENGAPSHIKNAINKKIINKMWADQPHQINKTETKDKYFPFAGKTEAEINFILASDLTTKFNKVFYAHFDDVFSKLEYESSLKNLDFYELDEAVQRALIDTQVNDIISEIESDSSSDIDSAFSDAGSKAPANVEADSKAKLKGSISGVQGVLDIQKSFAEGTTDKNSALTMLEEIYGFTEDIALKILGAPKIIKLPKTGTALA